MTPFFKRFVSVEPLKQTQNKVVANGGTHSSAPTTQPAPKFAGSWFTVLLSLGLSAMVALYASAPVALPSSYALCSRDENSIYTVDDLNTQTQCLVVSNSHIVDTGTLGNSNLLSNHRC
jgi:hypothetical protein